MVTITEIKECARNKDRVNLYADGEFLMAVYLDTAIANHLKKGAVLDVQALEEIRRQDAERYAAAVAMEYISYKMRTEREVRNKLKTKDIDPQAIDYAVGKLTEYGYLNDREYAQTYAQELLQRFGPRVAVQKLMEKGIARELAEQAARAQEQPEDVLSGLVERLRSKYAGDEPQKRKQKMIRALMSKGFEYDEIKSALSRDEE